MSIKESLVLLAKVNPTAFAEMDKQVTGYLTTAGAGLTLEQILFVKAHFAKLPDFFATPEGRVAVQTLVQDWIDHVKRNTQP